MKIWKKGRKAASQKEIAPDFSLLSSGTSLCRSSKGIETVLRLLIMELGMFGSAWSFFSAMDLWPEGSALAVWLVLYAAAAAFIYSSENWPFLLLLPVAPLAIWAYFTFDTLTTGLISFLNQTLQTMSENSPWRFIQFALEPMPDTELRWAETHFLVLLFCLLALGAGFFVVRRPWMPGFLLFTAPFPMLPLFFTLVPDLWAFFSLLTAWAMMAVLHQPLRRRPEREQKKNQLARQKNVRQQVALLLGICVILSSVTAATVLPRESFQRPQSLQEWVGSIGNWTQRLFHAQNDLHNLPALHFTGATALEVQCTVRQPLYLRGYAAGEFTGSGWEVLPDSEYEKASSLFSTDRVNPQNLYGVYWEDLRDSYRMSVRNVAPNRNSLYLPGGLITDVSRMSGAWYRQDLYAETRAVMGVGEYNVQAFTLPDLSNVSLRFADGTVPEAFQPAETEQGMDILLENYEAFLYEPYTALPEETFENAQTWWRQYIGQEGTVGLRDACAILQEVFNQEFTYQYDPPSFPQGKEYLQWFLEEAKAGYCVHYATAGVLLLRALGIPTRFAEGYIVTEDDYLKGKMTSDGFVQIPDNHAHAWAEVYDPVGKTWIPVEFTPGFSEESFWESPSGVQEPDPTPTPAATEKPQPTATPSPTPQVTPTPEPEAEPTPEAQSSPTPPAQMGEGEGPGGTFQLPGWLWPVLAAAICVLLMVAGVIFRRNHLLKKQNKARKQRNVNLAVREYWKWSFQMLSLAGAPAAENTDTPEEYAERLCSALPGLEKERVLAAYEIGQQAEFSGKLLEEEKRRDMQQWADYLYQFLHKKMGFWAKLRARWYLGLL